MRRGVIYIIIALWGLLLSLPAFSATKAEEGDTLRPKFKNHLIAPKKGWQCGLSVMYADFSSSNSEYMLLLQGLDANASMLKIAPEAAYTFADNHAVGIKYKFTNIRGMVDAATLDLLGNFSMSLDNIHANSRSMSAEIYQRTYIGLDELGRIGLFWDYQVGYDRSNLQFSTGTPNSSYSLKSKVYVGLSPGFVYFPMNNVSLQASISIADLSFNSVRVYSEGEFVGSRMAWRAQASLNVLNLYFGITIHL